jgi:hypothetical protein
VTRLDRLARITFDLFAIVKRIVDVAALSSLYARTSFIRPALRSVRYYPKDEREDQQQRW